jgi:hypothetical protein
MDYRCPACRADLGKRHKLSQAIVARMETDCPHCKRRIRLNVHRAETIIVLLNFGMVVVLGALAYWFQSQGLVILVAGAVMLGTLALPLLEQTCLRAWPRYAAMRSPES